MIKSSGVSTSKDKRGFETEYTDSPVFCAALRWVLKLHLPYAGEIMLGGSRTIALVPPLREGDSTTRGVVSPAEYNSFKSRASIRGISANRTATDDDFSRVAKSVDCRTPALSPCPSWRKNVPAGNFASFSTLGSGETTKTRLNNSASSTAASTSLSNAMMSFFLSCGSKARESLLLLSSSPFTGMIAKSFVKGSPPASRYLLPIGL